MEGSIVPIVAKKADELSKPLGSAVAGTLADAWHAILGDKVVAWRLKNAAKVSEKLEKEVAERGLTLKTAALPESYAYRWFEKASEEDEPELQALFAKLLANAASGNEAALQRQNIDLVSRLTPDAASLLSQVASKYRDARERLAHHKYPTRDISAEIYFADGDIEEQHEVATAILLSLGILRSSIELVDRSTMFSMSWKSSVSQPRSSIKDTAKLEEYIVLTVLGANLIEALYPSEQSDQ
ncbi:hypothetical protein GGR39_003447 [Novosphingobium fluoreni]|uniref:DUF4393 domain-containing protein n=1 Tax=Novosphingobium fluoreni TaxID=1391222 RepID=A0A7W6C1H6_9SPHN|nr:hypothetical protein [Novosphingobium fluoreni]MBB3941766.1 hypothetical protein [Novosphingobium fluoreni]